MRTERCTKTQAQTNTFIVFDRHRVILIAKAYERNDIERCVILMLYVYIAEVLYFILLYVFFCIGTALRMNERTKNDDMKNKLANEWQAI